MHLKLDRIGPFLSDRIVLDKDTEGMEGLHADYSLLGWILRVISWIYSPSCYTSENRRTIACVKKYLIDQIGQERLARACGRYGMSLDDMEELGSPLLSRDIAKIVTSIQDVKIEDIEELIKLAKKDEGSWPAYIDRALRDQLIIAANAPDFVNATDLSSEVFAQVYQALGAIVQTNEVDKLIAVAKEDVANWPAHIDLALRNDLRKARNYYELRPEILTRVYEELDLVEPFAIIRPIIKDMPGALPTEMLAGLFFDPLLADRERLVLCKENPSHFFESFVHHFVVRIIGREMEVGMLIPASDLSELEDLSEQEDPVAPNPPPQNSSKEEDLSELEDPVKLNPPLPRQVSRKPQPPLMPQFYKVSAKIISDMGMVSYILTPATKDSFLRPIRFFRGTSVRPSAIDSSSTMITDMETDLGRSSYESGKIYKEKLKEIFPEIPLAAGHSLGSTTLQYMVVDDIEGEIKKAYFFNGPGLPSGVVEEFNVQIRERKLPPLKLVIQEPNTDILSHIDDAEGEIKKANFFNGPRLPSEVVEECNVRNRKKIPPRLKLVIRDSNTDIFSHVGTKHLGWEAPIDKVDIDYFKWFPRYKTSLGYAHVQVPDRENRFAGIEGLHQGLPKVDDVGEDPEAMFREPGELSVPERKRKLKEAEFARAEKIRIELDAQLNREAYPGRVILCLSNEALRQLIGPCIAVIITLVRDIFRLLFGSRAFEQRGLHYGYYDDNGEWQTDRIYPEELSPQEIDPLEPAAALIPALA